MKYFTLLFCLLFSFQLIGQRYVLFNPSCTERLKYNNQFGEEEIAYTLQISATERIILEIGEEAKNYKSRISGALISCNNPNLGRSIADRINNNSGTTFYMVRKEGKGKFLVSPILSAAYFRFDNGEMEYATKSYAFQYDMRQNQRNTNLNTMSTATQVFFVGSTNYDCRKGYTFSISDRNGGLSDLTILPEIGVVDNVAFDSKRRLGTINATKFRDFLSAVCNGNTIYNDPALAGVDEREIDFENDFGNRRRNNSNASTSTTDTRTEPVSTPNPRTTRSNTSTSRSASSSDMAHRDIIVRDEDDFNTDKRLATDVAKGDYRTEPYPRETDTYNTRGGYGTVRSTTSGDMHTVQKGETAYSIAKAYGISLTQLQDWNNMSGYTIYPNQRLMVRATSDRFGSRGSVAATDPVSRPVNTRPNTSTTSSRYGVPAWHTTNGVHVVERGETARSIAVKYGYTVERFMDLNGLSTSTTLYTGQRLQTTDCSARPEEETNSRNTNAVRTNYFEDEFMDKGIDEDITPISPAPYYTSQSRLYGDYDERPRREGQTHRVRSRETLFTISRMYNTSVGELMQLNGMEVAEALLPGQVIFVK